MGWNDGIIQEFRENRGYVETMGFGDRLVIVHSTGAKTGRPHEFPVAGLPDGDGARLIAASKAGAPDNPAWFHNLLAHPDVDVEMPDPSADNGIRTVAMHAERLHGMERDEAWERFKQASPGFASYEDKAAPRVIPIFRLTPR
jgi:deazaflavin-dependent oxidoreductase (nitroreductase family)